jgi:hypothetical protein
MAYSTIAHTIKSSTTGNTVTTSAIDTSGADFIVLAVMDYTGATISSISDSKGNSWNQLSSGNGSSIARGTLYWSRPSSVGAGHTFTATGSSNFPTVIVEAWSDSAASPFDQESVGGDPGFSSTISNPGSVTPSQNDELLVTLVSGNDTSESWTIDSGFTISDQAPAVSGQCIGGGMAYLIQTTAAAKNPTWTNVGNITSGSTIATFKSGGAPPPSVVVPINLLMQQQGWGQP